MGDQAVPLTCHAELPLWSYLRADECKILRIEKQSYVFALVVGKGDLRQFPVYHGSLQKRRSRKCYSSEISSMNPMR